MIFFSIGLPGRFSQWCDAIVARLIESAVGPVMLAPAQSPEVVAFSLLRLTEPHLVVTSRHASEGLRALLSEARGRVLVALDDPRFALRELAAANGGNFRDATQEAARSCAAAYVCAGLPDVLVIHAGRGEHDAAATVATLGGALGITLGEAAIGEILAALPCPSTADAADELEAWWDSLDPGHRALGGGALGAYVANFRDGGFYEIIWDHALFWRHGEPSLPADEAIDIGDASRLLVNGPQIDLPPGDWQATITLGVSKEATGIGFDVEITAMAPHAVLARGHIAPDGRGIGTATLPFSIEASYGRSIGVTIVNTGAAPGGRLALGHVTLAPRSADGSDIPSELTTVLGL
ncbi:MAG TPA: hypothetical protein VND87_08740 [Stellaceae bacterium]|nr:hypothetical protein [Stellaceae bacterium]